MPQDTVPLAAPTPINSSAGELVPITPENALKIKQAVQDATLRGLLSYSLTKLKRLQRDLDRILA